MVSVIMMIVTMKPIMLNVIHPSVIMLTVMVPNLRLKRWQRQNDDIASDQKIKLEKDTLY